MTNQLIQGICAMFRHLKVASLAKDCSGWALLNQQNATLSNWQQRQSSDVYVKAAKAENYRCRSAFKLVQIDEAYRIFKKKERIVDLGAAPGSWSQVAVQRSVSTSQVISVDIKDFEPVPGTIHLPKTSIEDIDVISDVIQDNWQDQKAQLVLSDMLHNVSGEKTYDHINSIKLCSNVLKFCFQHLEDNGSVVMKIYHGPHEEKFILLLRKYFKNVFTYRPDASRKTSREKFIIGKQFQSSVLEKPKLESDKLELD